MMYLCGSLLVFWKNICYAAMPFLFDLKAMTAGEHQYLEAYARGLAIVIAALMFHACNFCDYVSVTYGYLLINNYVHACAICTRRSFPDKRLGTRLSIQDVQKDKM